MTEPLRIALAGLGTEHQGRFIGRKRFRYRLQVDDVDGGRSRSHPVAYDLHAALRQSEHIGCVRDRIGRPLARRPGSFGGRWQALAFGIDAIAADHDLVADRRDAWLGSLLAHRIERARGFDELLRGARRRIRRLGLGTNRLRSNEHGDRQCHSTPAHRFPRPRRFARQGLAR